MIERVAPAPSSRRPAAGKTRPLSPSRPPHRFSPALLRRLDGVWVELTPDLARALAHKSMVGIATSIRERRERTARRAAAMAYRRQEQALLVEEREAERRNRALWRRVKIKAPKDTAPERKPHRPTRSGFLGGASPLPSYSGAIVDRLGRRSVFVRIRYYGRKTARPGVGRRVAIYIYEGAVRNADGTVCLFSNVAETPEEAIAAMELLEQVNREASVDAKLLFHLIANLPHELTVDQMMEEARRFAEAQFGSRDLPYVVALHPPSAEGDQRNWHVHILASTRPMRRVGNHEWELGEQLRTEIDNPEAFRRMRELYAAIQTEVAEEAGLGLVYTALSNAARGLPNKPQQHLGGPLTDLVRRGAVVGANERNREAVVEGERALLDERQRHGQEASHREASLLARAAAPFSRRAAEPKLAPAVLGSVAFSNLKRAALAPTAQDRMLHAGTGDVPLAILLPVSRSMLGAAPNVPLLVTAGTPLDALPTATPSSRAVSNLKPALPVAVSLPLSSVEAEPMPIIPSMSSSTISPVALRPVALDRSDRMMALTRSLIPSVRASVVFAKPLVGEAISDAGPAPVANDVGRTLAPAHLPLRQAPGVVRLSDTLSTVAVSQANTDRALSQDRARQRSVLVALEVPRVPPTAVDAPDLNLIVVHRLIAQRHADAKRRKAAREREAAALVIKRAAEEAAEQAAAHAAEFADLEQLRVLDPLVAEFRRKGLSVPDETLVAIGRDTDWERTAPVQRALAAMLVDQNARLERMEHDADGTPPVVVVNGQLMPAAHLAPDLARSVERWSSDPAFRAVAAVLWPAPPPVAASPEVALGAVPTPASTQPEDAIERNRRWAAAYRERLMVASDADQRWDADAGFGRSRDERVEAEPPTRTKVTSATLAVRLRADHGLGG